MTPILELRDLYEDQRIRTRHAPAASDAWGAVYISYRGTVIILPHMHPIVLSLLLGLTAAAANVFGGAIIVQKHWDRSYLRYFVALGAGFMLATAIVEVFPAALELRGKSAAFLVLVGYLIIHFFEHTVTTHFHFGEETHQDQFVHTHKGYSILIGLIIHTFFDGIAIASGFLVSNWLGWIIFLAIFLHKIPEGFTITSVMLASGQSRSVAWGASVLLGIATFAGVAAMAIFQHEVSFGLPLSAGVTIYVAASDLIPEVNREPGAKMALVVFLGVGLMFLLDLFVHALMWVTSVLTGRTKLDLASLIVGVLSGNFKKQMRMGR